MDIDLELGTELAAAGKTLGMSIDEVMQYVSRKKRAAEKQNGKSYSNEDFIRSFIERVNLANEVRNENPADLAALDKYQEENKVGGEDQSDFQNILPGEELQGSNKREPNVFRKFETVKGADGKRRRVERQIILGENEPLRDPDIRENELLRDFGLREDRDEINLGVVRRGANILEREFGPQQLGKPNQGIRADSAGKRYVRGRRGIEVENEYNLPTPIVANRGAVAPAQKVIEEARKRAQAKLDREGAEANPGLADIVGRLEDDLGVNRDAERALAGELIRRDRANQNTEVQKRNQAQFNKDKYYMRQWAGPNNPINRLGDIRLELGMPFGQTFNAGNGTANVNVPANMIEGDNPANYPDAYKYAGADVYVGGPGGDSLANDDYNFAARYGASALNPNTPGSSQALNAPTNPTLNDLIQRELLDREFINFPQVGIGKELDLFAERLANLKDLAPQGNRNVRNLAEAEALFDEVLNRQAEMGIKMYRKDEDGRNSFVENPGINEVLEKMRYSSTERRNLMNALYQLEMAGSSPVNRGQKDIYLQGGNYVPQKLVGNPLADLSVPGGVIQGRNYYDSQQLPLEFEYANNRNKPQFRALEGGANPSATPQEQAEALIDAQRPYIGIVKDDPVPIEGKLGNPNYRFIGNKNRNYADMDPADVAIAIEAERMRQLKPGQELNTAQRARLNQNIDNALQVQERAKAPAPQRGDGAAGRARRQERIKSVLDHAGRDKPTFTPRGDVGPEREASAKRKIKGMAPAELGNLMLNEIEGNRPFVPDVNPNPLEAVVNERAPIRNVNPDRVKRDPRLKGNPAERVGLFSETPADPAPARKDFNPNEGKTVVDLGTPEPITNFRNNRFERAVQGRVNQARNIMDTIRAPQNTTRRRIGYAVAGAAGLGGLAGLLSGERQRREEEAMR